MVLSTKFQVFKLVVVTFFLSTKRILIIDIIVHNLSKGLVKRLDNSTPKKG
jgi:hypothetical protein